MNNLTMKEKILFFGLLRDWIETKDYDERDEINSSIIVDEDLCQAIYEQSLVEWNNETFVEYIVSYFNGLASELKKDLK